MAFLLHWRQKPAGQTGRAGERQAGKSSPRPAGPVILAAQGEAEPIRPIGRTVFILTELQELLILKASNSFLKNCIDGIGRTSDIEHVATHRVGQKRDGI
jgi:hypothetical protein